MQPTRILAVTAKGFREFLNSGIENVILRAVTMKSTIFWVVILWRKSNISKEFIISTFSAEEQATQGTSKRA
jgi:hypothetical protein